MGFEMREMRAISQFSREKSLLRGSQTTSLLICLQKEMGLESKEQFGSRLEAYCQESNAFPKPMLSCSSSLYCSCWSRLPPVWTRACWSAQLPNIPRVTSSILAPGDIFFVSFFFCSVFQHLSPARRLPLRISGVSISFPFFFYSLFYFISFYCFLFLFSILFLLLFFRVFSLSLIVVLLFLGVSSYAFVLVSSVYFPHLEDNV